MNLLYIHTHDTGRCISPYGYAVDTPNFQRFCDDAMLFERAHSVASICSPSRACLFTGTYPHQNGMLGLAQRGFEIRSELHMARLLASCGYRTALCGVQHEVGYYTDHEQGAAVLGYELDLTADVSPYAERELVAWDCRNAERLSSWIRSNRDERPFFVSFGMHATHRAYPLESDTGRIKRSVPPCNAPNTPETRADYAGFCRSVHMADECLGIVLSALIDSGSYDDTLIVLTTDHGIAYPFAKSTLLDAGTGVLLAIRVPGAARMRGVCDALVSHIDVLPTVLELLDIEAPTYLEGVSFARLFSGEEFRGDGAVFGSMNFHTSYEPARSVRTERYAYIRRFDAEYTGINCSNIDDSPVKEWYREQGLLNREKPSELLFDLACDRFETNNLATDAAYLGVLDEMRELLTSHLIETNDPILKGPIAVQSNWKVNAPQCYSAHSKNPSDYISIGSGICNASVRREED